MLVKILKLSVWNSQVILKYIHQKLKLHWKLLQVQVTKNQIELSTTVWENFEITCLKWLKITLKFAHHYWWKSENVCTIIGRPYKCRFVITKKRWTCTTGGIQPRGTPSESLKLRILVKKEHISPKLVNSIFLTPGGSGLERGITQGKFCAPHRTLVKIYANNRKTLLREQLSIIK